MDQQLAMAFVSLLPLMLMLVPYAFGVYFLAPRLGKSRVLWVILCLIPVVNFFFLIYMMFQVMFHVLDRLNDIKTSLDRDRLKTL